MSVGGFGMGRAALGAAIALGAVALVAGCRAVPVPAPAPSADAARFESSFVGVPRETEAKALRPGAPEAALENEVDLEALLERVARRSHELALAEEAVAEARAERIAAGLLPNPALEFEGLWRGRGADTIDGREHLWTISQPLLLPGQRRLRVRGAEAGVRGAGEELRFEEQEVFAEARLLFAALGAAVERVALLEAALADLARVAEIVELQVEVGARGRADGLRLSAERAVLEVERVEAEEHLAEVQSELARLVGAPGWRPMPRAGEPWLRRDGAAGLGLGPGFADGETEGRAALLEGLVDALPAVSAARERVEAAEAAYELARRERWPAPVARFGWRETRSEYSQSWLGGVELDLPVFDRNQGEVAGARARLRAARIELDREVVRGRVRVERALERWAVRSGALERFDAAAGMRFEELRDLAEAAYEAGQSGVLEWLDALEALRALRIERLGLAEALAEAEVELRRAVGRTR